MASEPSDRQLNLRPVRPELADLVERGAALARQSKAKFLRLLLAWALVRFFKAGGLDELLGKGVGESQLITQAQEAESRLHGRQRRNAESA